MTLATPGTLTLADEGELNTAKTTLDVAKIEFLEGKRADAIQHVAEGLVMRYRCVTEPITQKLYVYDRHDGFYRVTGEEMLRHDMVQTLEKHATKFVMSEVLAKVRAMSYKDLDTLKMTVPPNLKPLKNGVYDLNTNTLRHHSPERFFTYTHPITYDPSATCPEFLAFLNTVTREEREREILLDIIALCLYRARVTRHFFVLVGGGRNGKTAYINHVRALLGKDRTVSITPQALAVDTFAAAQLYDRHANIGAEVTGATITDIGIVKAATGGDTISTQRKGVDRSETETYCEFIWASNTPPKITEDTLALWDRMVVVTFPFTFVENPNAPNEKKADPEIETKLNTQEELSGLFNLAVQRLPALLKNRKLSVPINPNDTRRNYRVLSDTVATFLEEACEEVEYDPGPPATGYETATNLYRAYKAWCKGNDTRPVTLNSFGRSVPKHGYDKGKNAPGQGVSYSGLKLKGTVGSIDSIDSPILPVPELKDRVSIEEIGTNGPIVNTNPVSFEVLLNQLCAQHPERSRDILTRVLETNLAKRAEDGEIFSPRPGFYAAVAGEVRL